MKLKLSDAKPSMYCSWPAAFMASAYVFRLAWMFAGADAADVGEVGVDEVQRVHCLVAEH